MNDQLTPKALDASTLDAANYPGAAMAFERVASDGKFETRRSVHISAENPTDIRIAHTLQKGSAPKRAFFATDQTLTRLDASNNVIRLDQPSIGTTFIQPANVTEAEMLILWQTHVGVLVASTNDMVKRLLRGER